MNQHKLDPNLKVGIFIPTMNRSEFIVRQLNYYAFLDCPHTIYIGDSSNQEHSDKTRKAINDLGDRIKVIYEYSPSLGGIETIRHLLSIIKEPYTCFSGDDDYQISDSLTKSAEFLENNQDYATAGGYAVSFRLKGHGVYGNLDRLADYPRLYINSDTARERVVKYLERYYVPLFLVNRTKDMLRYFGKENEIKDKSFEGEIIPSTLSIIAGKSAILDCLGFIRQIHDSHLAIPNVFDWIIQPIWLESYEKFERIISEAISKRDGISYSEARETTRLAFWSYLQMWLAKDYKNALLKKGSDKSENSQIKNIRNLIKTKLPLVRATYRGLKPFFSRRRYLHNEVLQKNSKYYTDFKLVMDSFTGQIKP